MLESTLLCGMDLDGLEIEVLVSWFVENSLRYKDVMSVVAIELCCIPEFQAVWVSWHGS